MYFPEMPHQSTICPRCGNSNADQYRESLNAGGRATEVLHIWCGQCLYHAVNDVPPRRPVTGSAPLAAQIRAI